MTTVKNKDSITLDYIGSFPETGQIFDTSIESVAKENGIHNSQREYTPLAVTVGEGQVIPGLDQALVDMELDQTKTIDIPAADAYGERLEDRILSLPKDQFGSTNITPEIGMMLQTEAGIATITEINEETVILDFNHALAGRDLRFEVTITAIN